jgi:hypothetical protein
MLRIIASQLWRGATAFLLTHRPLLAGTTNSRPHREADARCRVGLNDSYPLSPPAQVDPKRSYKDPKSSGHWAKVAAGFRGLLIPLRRMEPSL